MTDVRRQILEILVDLSEMHPSMRFGQLVENLAMWSYGPGPEATYEVEDEQFLEGARGHLERRRAHLEGEPDICVDTTQTS